MEPLALYIHWPFCAAKCPYCDFNSHVRDRVDHARHRAALRRELAFEAARANAGGRRPLTSIFFGGGTPSLMEPETVAALIADATALFDAAPDIEITLEANPTSVEAGKLRAFRAAGVNRASLGVQALREDPLRFLGRRHDARQAIAALELARDLFPRLSFDLIYARPGQEEADWRAELREALALAADHLSLYQLTIEPGTRFATEHARGAFALPEDEDAARLYAATAEEAGRFGLLPYEVSNYAKPGAESRHNLQYWRYGDYLGVGAGAHQRLSCPQTPGAGSAGLAFAPLGAAPIRARGADAPGYGGPQAPGGVVHGPQTPGEVVSGPQTPGAGSAGLAFAPLGAAPIRARGADAPGSGGPQTPGEVVHGPQAPGAGSAGLAFAPLGAAPVRARGADAPGYGGPQAPGGVVSGPQAPSRDVVLLAARRHRAPEEWLARVERDGHAITEEEALAPLDRAREALLMGLRLAEGIDPARIEARSGLPFASTIDRAILEACQEEGYLAWTPEGRLHATMEGRLRLDALLPALLR